MKPRYHLPFQPVVHLAVLLVITTLTFLPNLAQAKIYRDDWYYTMDRYLGGPEAFHYMFAMDRPARGYFFEVYYRLFGVEPLPYHLASFAARLLLGAAAYALFLALWPRRYQQAFIISLLFLIYPGYTRWMEGFENQPNIIMLLGMVVSFLLALLAIRSRAILPKVVLWSGSILGGLVYLYLVDYAIGMEFFRWLCIYLVVSRGGQARTWLQKAAAALRAGIPAVLVPGIFLFWRLLIFKNQRAETDLGLQFGSVLESPLTGLASWFISLVKSVVNTAVVAWASPPVSSFFQLSPDRVFTGLLLALICAAVLLLGISLSTRAGALAADGLPSDEAGPWRLEAVWIGIIGLVFGVLPVVLVNRSVALGPFSHYTVPASLAVAALAGGLLYNLCSNRFRAAALVTLVSLSVITHYSASAQVLVEEQAINQFWHQVVWRAPGIREATGLLVSYPGVNYGEDIDAVAGPANFLYFPQPQNQLPVRYALQAMKLYPWTVNEYLTGNKYTLTYRSHYGVIDPGYLLVMTQPTPQSCVHVIDRTAPWFSFDDPAEVVVVGQNSNLSNILPDAQPPSLPPSIFGPEPEHGWCYYYQKAELALQQQDWQAVQALANEASQQGAGPSDPLEWLPFIQAHARLGDVQGLRSLLERVTAGQVEYNRVQVCNVLTRRHEQEAFSPVVQAEIEQSICSQPVSE